MIDDYRPVAVTGEAAERIVRLIDARSAAPAESERIEAFQVGGVLVETQPRGMERATVRFERNSGVVELDRRSITSDVVVGASEPATLPPCLLLRADELPDGVEYGVDLFRWGGFDDNTADGDRGEPMHWVTPESSDRWSLVQGPTDDPNDDALELVTDANEPVSARFVARVGIAEHRLYDTDDGRPADAAPSYTISLDALRERGEEPELRLVVYTVDDEDPTSDPESTVIRDVEIPLPVTDGDGWNPMTIELARRHRSPRSTASRPMPPCCTWSRRPPSVVSWRSTTCGSTSGAACHRPRSSCGPRSTRSGRLSPVRTPSPCRAADVDTLTPPMTPLGRVDDAASVAGAEGATTPESLRRTDRMGEARAGKQSARRLADGESPHRVKLSGTDDSGGASRAVSITGRTELASEEAP